MRWTTEHICPLIAFDGKPASLNLLVEYTEAAERLGFVALAANDHLLFSRPGSMVRRPLPQSSPAHGT